MGFLGRIIKPLVENAFDRMQSEAMQARLKEQDKKISKVQSLFPIQELFNFGPMANITATYTTGIGVARTELQNVLGTAFAPLTRDIAAFTGGVRNLFEDYFFQNRLGGAIGQGLGQAAGFIAGFILPGGPLLWSQIFGFLGTFAGTFVQDFIESGPYEHPPVPGSPWEILPTPGPYDDLPAHAQEYIYELDQAITTDQIPAPVYRQQIRIGGHFI